MAIIALLPAITLISEPFDYRIGLALGTLLVVGIWTTLFLFAPIVQVTKSEFSAGQAVIDRKFIGEVEIIDKDRIFHERGPGLNPAAFRLFQGTVQQGVKVEILDPQDPTPYWLISTRKPSELKRALENKN